MPLKAYDTLTALVEGPMKKSLLSGDVFAFIGRTRKSAKALYFDGTGLCLLCKRLETGHFAAPWKRLVAEDVAAGRLQQVLPDLEAGDVKIVAIHPTRRLLEPRVRRFIDLMVEELGT